MDVRNDKPEDDYEAHPCRWIDLGFGAASVAIPAHWTERSFDINEAAFDVAELPGASFAVRLSCYEDPEAIRGNDLEHYINHPSAPPLSEDALASISYEGDQPDFEQLTVHYGCTEGGRAGDPNVTAEIDIWRRLHLVRPGHIRVIEFMLHMPLGSWDDEGYRRAIVSALRALIRETNFAEAATSFDRVAPKNGLKITSFWDCIHMRVPEAWEPVRENSDGTGMFVFDDDRGRERWALWIDYDLCESDGPMETFGVVELVRQLGEAMKQANPSATVAVDPLDDRPGEAMIAMTLEDEEDGELVRYTHWSKVVITEAGYIMAKFNWVVRKNFLADDDIPGLTDLVEREVCNALVVAPPALA